ncbi:MAG: DUF4417 domain-containing protein [Bifidobacteriaceae bacterium]|jgi:hypothetical protein|nr:DUF4417 domain-containing protein [Bifidobacteriaceae bacterium]
MDAGEVRSRPLEWYFGQGLPVEGRYDMPLIAAQDVDLETLALVRFTSIDDGDAEAGALTVHFFEDDERFDQVWNRPEVQVDRLRAYKQVLSPDFSLFTDRPVVEQIVNTYRNRWCGALWQREGLTVIPTASWSDGASFDFCFDGLEEGSVVAISTVGVRDLQEGFMRGYREMVRIVRPETVVCYGTPFEEMAGVVPVVEVPYLRNAKVAGRLPGGIGGR